MNVSVIVPNYNHAAFLKQRLDSILAQTYQDFELIILDDCSTDGSRAIIEKYRNHPKVAHVILNEQNSGTPFKQWGKGLALAQGEWIWIAESDDYAHQDLLQQLVVNSQTKENIVLSYCQSVEVDEEGKELRTMLWWVSDLHSRRWTADYTNNGNQEIADYLLYKNTIPNASAVLFKKAAYSVINDRYTRLKRCGDWLFWIHVLQAGNISYTAQPLNFFRRHAATTRVLDTEEKLRSRLAEEYLIWQYIKQNVADVRRQNSRKRLKQLITLYRETYTRKEMLGFFWFPFRYRGQLPLRWLLADYLEDKIKAMLFKQGGSKHTKAFT